MLKKLLFYVVPFLTPFILFGLYWLLAKRRAGQGKTMVPWLWLVVCGIVLSIGTATVLAFVDGHEPGMEYIPPRVEDGVLKPGEYRPRP
ncbi:DUF6111 family protein [Minwuia sp.]|uniref:DUF6111 family protein n=1 Tax=Minwuia sp. TaxID=2493630 RepID=UPI003A8D38EF